MKGSSSSAEVVHGTYERLAGSVSLIDVFSNKLMRAKINLVWVRMLEIKPSTIG